MEKFQLIETVTDMSERIMENHENPLKILNQRRKVNTEDFPAGLNFENFKTLRNHYLNIECLNFI